MSTQMPDYGLSFSSSDSVAIALNAQEHAEKFLRFQIKDPNYKHQLSCAQLWAINKDHTYVLLNAHPDIYEILSEELYDFSQYAGILIHTSGWAAPLDESGNIGVAPSQHDSRRRVALASCVTPGSVGSALSFSDDPTDVVLDPGSATGSLAEALVSFWEKNTNPF